MAGVSSRFSFATATTIQLFGCLFGKKWCLEKRIAKEIENYERTQLNTLFERFYAEIKNKHGETSKRRFHFIESDSNTD